MTGRIECHKVSRANVFLKGRGHPSKSPHVTVTTSMKTNVIFGSYITDVMRVDEADMNLKERFLLTGIHSATDIL